MEIGSASLAEGSSGTLRKMEYQSARGPRTVIRTWVSTDGHAAQVASPNADRTPAPWGFRKSLVKCYEDYAREAGQTIRVFENGYAVDGEETLPVEQALKDEERSEFYEGNLRALCDAVVHDGVKVGTFTAWSLLE